MKKLGLLFYLLLGSAMFILCCPDIGVTKQKLIPEYFGIYTARLDGKSFTEILRDSKRQTTHARVSNDHKWIVFTRFNNLNSQGIAIAEDGYEQTEIMLCRTDGSELQTLVPPKKGIANANAYWTSDNKGITYISTDNPEKIGQIYFLDLATRKRTRLPTPKGLHASDPQMSGGYVVYPGTKKGNAFVIRIMNTDGTNDRQLSSIPEKQSKGEFDPKISPDMSKVAFMRFGKKGGTGDVYIIVTDIKTGVEKNLSVQGKGNLDAMPEWSSDGKLLVFWHLNWNNALRTIGIYTIRPNGSERRKISLPKYYWYTQPSFFPGTGSGKDAKIIFSVRRFPAEAVRELQR